MSAHIGIVACSAEGAALCYRTICAEAPAILGEHRHPEITMHTHCLADYMGPIRAGNWQAVAELMLSSVRKCSEAGARFAICPDNTIHQALPLVLPASPIPWLSIAEGVGREAIARGFRKLAITGTKYLTVGPVYPEALKKLGLSWEIPDAGDRETIDTIIFRELVNGIVREESRLRYNAIVASLKKRGCDAVVMGCTEIPLLVNPADCPLPPLDSTRLLARAALQKSTAAPRPANPR